MTNQIDKRGTAVALADALKAALSTSSIETLKELQLQYTYRMKRFPRTAANDSHETASLFYHALREAFSVAFSRETPPKQ